MDCVTYTSLSLKKARNSACLMTLDTPIHSKNIPQPSNFIWSI